MSDDLISRKALLGAECLLMTDIVENNPTAKYILEQVLYDVEHAETAFDKEKVIGELNEKADYARNRWLNSIKEGQTKYWEGKENGIREAIEVIEKGGIE